MKYIVFYSWDAVDGEDYAEFSSIDLANTVEANLADRGAQTNFLVFSA